MQLYLPAQSLQEGLWGHCLTCCCHATPHLDENLNNDICSTAYYFVVMYKADTVWAAYLCR